MMNHKKENMDEEKSFEVIQEDAPNKFEGPHLVRRGLTEVSAMFDRNGKGYLDDTERALRRMDSQDRGYLGVDKVCVIFESLQAEQERSSQLLEALRMESKKSLNLKKGVIALTVFSIVLALANVGTSFAISQLVKETSVSNGDLLVKGSDVRIGTTDKLLMFEMSAVDETRRRRLQSNAGLICEQMAETIVNANGSVTTEKECSLQGVIKLPNANNLHNQLNNVDKVVLTCNNKKSTILGNMNLPPGNPGMVNMGTMYKVFPSGSDTNAKYDAFQKVFVPGKQSWCTAAYELAIYCPVELINGQQQECLVMSAFLPTAACPTSPVVCGPPPQTFPLIN